MSVTISTFQNFVGGKWVDAAEGGTAEIINPSTGDTIAEVPNGTQADVDRAVDAAKAALPEWLETTPGERAEALLKLADALDANTEELAQLESQNVGKPVPAARDEIPVCVGQHPLLRGRGAAARGPRGRRVHARLHVDDPPRAGRHRRPDRALELPADDGRLEDRARARGRQRRRAQAVRADAADARCAWPSWPRRSSRRAS